MKRRTLWMAVSVWASAPAWAILDIGDKAPDFSADGALAGKPFRFSLSEALKRGPVVLYFFPAAFSEGCSLEAHEFAEAIPRFQALGATVVGVSADDLETLMRFSVRACQGQFAVLADEQRSVIRSFDALLQTRPEYANRVSYVIVPGGTVVAAYQSLNPVRHVERMLAGVREWREDRTRR